MSIPPHQADCDPSRARPAMGAIRPARARRIAAALAVLAGILPATAGDTASAAPGSGSTGSSDQTGIATTMLGPGREVVADEVLVRFRGEPVERAVPVGDGETVAARVSELRRDPEVRWATPNPVARASWIPRDPGRSGGRGGWQEDQWNFLAPPPVGTPCDTSHPCGLNAPRAWDLLRRYGRPEGRRKNGRRGPIVAVIDTGVAYRNRKRFRRSPDLAPGAFVRGRDFVGDDRIPLDHNGHGTHVASTIFERTGNRRAVTGLADGLRMMPVRVLNGGGSGSAKDVARGVRWATRNGAKVINLSLEFGPAFDDCSSLRGVCHSIRKARSKGIVVVAAAGNAGASSAQMPAKVAFGVASGTIRGCLSDFSSRGPGIDITAPGGGPDSGKGAGGSHCRPFAPGPGIVQLTLKEGPASNGNFRRFGYPRYEGTSMAAPHVSAAAALVLSSRVLARKLGRRPGPGKVEKWLRCTARPVADPSKAHLYGAGLLDLAAALDRGSSCPALGV